MKIKHTILRSTTLIISFFSFLATIEVCARIDDALKYNAPIGEDYSDDRLRSRDIDGDPFNVPNAGFEKWQHNSLGFRGPEIPVNKIPGTTRIVCIGASESYGLHESPGKEWPAQLQVVLGNHGYQVVNASVAGLTLLDFSSYIRKHVIPLKPDIIVFVINPYFYVAGLQKDRETSHANPTSSGKLQISSIPSHLRILPKIKQVLKKAASDYLPQTLEKYQLTNLKRQVDELERLKLKGRKRKDSVPVSYASSFASDLEKLTKLCQSYGISVLLTTYPTLMEQSNIREHPVLFMDFSRFFIDFSYEGSIDIANKFNAAISIVAKKQHSMFVDTATVLPKSTSFFADNVHYTDRGSRLIAESIAKNILYQMQVKTSN